MYYKKKYEDLVIAVKALQEANPSDEGIKNWVADNVPELRQNEDEKIRKALIENFKWFGGDVLETSKWGKDDDLLVTDILAWLEKQGEQKHYSQMEKCINCQFIYTGYCNGTCILGKEKVEPKFKVGDWIITNKKHIWYVDETPETTSYLYRLINQYGKVEVADFEVVDKKARLWTIQDAKDGDVLDANGAPFIYKRHDKDYVYFYCGVNLADAFIEANGIDTWNINNKVYPATKEQRDLLFSKMKEAGYMWDAEKKEPKKIENKPLVIDEGKAEMDRNFTEMMLKDYTNQNPAWSEVDELTGNTLVNLVKYGSCIDKEEKYGLLDWLKSLKDRIHPQWKPSDEQMHYLYWIANIKLGDSVVEEEVSKHLNELYEDLKKLKG